MKKSKYYAIGTMYNHIIASGDHLAFVKERAEESIAMTARMYGWPEEGFGLGSVEAWIVSGSRIVSAYSYGKGWRAYKAPASSTLLQAISTFIKDCEVHFKAGHLVLEGLTKKDAAECTEKTPQDHSEEKSTEEADTMKKPYNTPIDKSKANPMCTDCARFGTACEGTACKTWTGCVYKQRADASTEKITEEKSTEEAKTMKTTTPKAAEKSTEKSTSKDFYQAITDGIIEELESGVIPWEKPWTGINGGAKSHITGKAYSLLNQMLLRKPGEYVTFQQCKAEGGRVKKGAKGHPVYFWKQISKELDELDESGEKKVTYIPVLRYYTVFHLDDCEGIAPKWADETPRDHFSEDAARQIANRYIRRESTLQLELVKGDRAYYNPARDTIRLPLREQFPDAARFYEVAFHEMTHSTGHASRLGRFSEGTALAAYGSEEYSKEELIAEIGSACLLHAAGLYERKQRRNSAAYIQSWLRVLKNDRRFIVSAASKAEKAVRYILGDHPEAETEDAPTQPAEAEPAQPIDEGQKDAARRVEELRNAVPSAKKEQIYDRATRWTKAHGWGITKKEMSKFICDHKTARMHGNVEKMMYIEEILTDCNFHSINKHLYNGDYAEAMHAANC